METEGGSATQETWDRQPRGLKCGISRGEANRNLVFKQWFSHRSAPSGWKPNILWGIGAPTTATHSLILQHRRGPGLHGEFVEIENQCL